MDQLPMVPPWEGDGYWCFAADEFHKAVSSGGENHHVRLQPGADFRTDGMYGVHSPQGRLTSTFDAGGTHSPADRTALCSPKGTWRRGLS